MVKFVEEKSALYLKDVTFYWARVHEPTLKYGSKTEKEYQIVCIISPEDVRALKKLRINKQPKEIGVDEDLDKYPNHEGDYVLKLSQNAHSSTGKELKIDVIDASGEVLEAEIGNGSTGNIKLHVMEGTGVSKGKRNIRLNTVLVKELKAVVKTSRNFADDEDLGVEVDDDTDNDDEDMGVSRNKSQQKQKPQQVAKRKKSFDEDFDEDDVPF